MDAGTQQPEHSSAHGDIPADLPLGDFPDPNPYFPPPVRPRTGLPWVLSLPMFVLGGPGVILLLTYNREVGDLVAIGGALICFIMFLVGMASFFQSFAYIPWRIGRILPALVTVRPQAPESQDAVGCLAGALVPFPLGLLLSASRGSKENPNTMIVRWIESGRLRKAEILAGEHWPKFGLDDVIWICRVKGLPPVVVQRACPKNFEIPSMPPDLASETRRELAVLDSMSKDQKRAYRAQSIALQRERRARETELNLAARRTKEAFDKTARYRKRPE